MKDIVLTFDEMRYLFKRLKKDEHHLSEVEARLLTKIEDVLYTRYSIAEMEELLSEDKGSA